MSDYALQRKNMVESQVRPSDVTDRRIVRAMQAVPRELFLPLTVRGLAYMEGPVPLDTGIGRRRIAPARQLMSPRTFAKLLVLAELEETDRVLVVGSGCGYSCQVLAEIAAAVIGLECDPRLVEGARASLAAAGMSSAGRIELVDGPLPAGLPAKAPFDVIVLEGAVPEVPQALMAQLAPGGRCVGVIATQTGMGRATRWRKVGDRLAETDVFEATVAPLPGFAIPKTFVL